MTSEIYWQAFGEIETITGAYFQVASSTFDIEAIAHGAARKCRFNGQCKFFYPVANHAVMVSRIMERLGGDPMEGLLHDANESYLPDVPSPYKRQLPDVCALEDFVDSKLREHFGLPLKKTPECQRADMLALMVEAYYLLPSRGETVQWDRLAQFREPAQELIASGFRIPLYDVPPDEAKQAFMQRYKALLDRPY